MSPRLFFIACAIIVSSVFAGLYLPQDNDNPAQQTATINTAPAVQITTETNKLKMRPSFQLPDITGKIRHIKEWDNRIVVLNFWATWCQPCLHEIPAFNKLHTKYQDKGVTFLGIAANDKTEIERFTKILPISYPILIGGEFQTYEIAAEFGNIYSIIPYTVFIAANGQIHSIAAGLLSEQETENRIKALL
ncbi:hypothetical protein MNBD_GAMMA16-1388 [hydrothermal vent metagenome]|uniref:Thioredoxin domain-containing protein n=1 Tax=hydrothermal vent metagenome TaxID=652676 RepID=A0A3B0ZSS9_9ZZZZ